MVIDLKRENGCIYLLWLKMFLEFFTHDIEEEKLLCTFTRGIDSWKATCTGKPPVLGHDKA